jgi:hypothetical protein
MINTPADRYAELKKSVKVARILALTGIGMPIYLNLWLFLTVMLSTAVILYATTAATVAFCFWITWVSSASANLIYAKSLVKDYNTKLWNKLHVKTPTMR